MTSALVHASGLSDSEEEATKYGLKELTKSSACTLNGIFHYERKIKTKEVQKDKIDMITAAMSVHGSDSPEVMFYGTILVRDWFLSVADNQPPTNVDSLISTAAQSAINAINIFRTRNSGDSTIVHATFSLLLSLLGKRLVLPQTEGSSLVPTLRQALADVVNTDLLLSISPDACGIMLASLPLVHELTDDPCFLKKEVVQFCLDFVSSLDVSRPDPTTRDIDSLYCYCLAYLSACLERSSGEGLSWTIGKLFSKSRIVSGVCNSLVPHVNTRHFLFTALRFLTQLLATGLWVMGQDGDDAASSVGIFGIVTGGGPGAPISGNKSRVPPLFDETDVESLDDIFSAFSDDNLQENDFQIPLVICAIGSCLTRFYGDRTTARATSVQTVVKRWALSAVISAEPLVAASGLSLVASMHASSGQSVSFLIHVDTFVGCLGSLSSRNPEWAKQEGFAFIRKLIDRPNVDSKEIGKYMQKYIEKFKFHPEIIRSKEIKELFFKSVSVKEAFGRLLDAVISDTVTYEQIVVVSRVLLQMMLAVKAKGSLGEFQAEILRIETERLQRVSESKKKQSPGPNMSIIAGLLRAVQLASSKNDMDTVEIIVHVFANLVENRTDKLDSIILKLILSSSLQKKLKSVLDPDGKPIPTPDLDFPESPEKETHVVGSLENFLNKCVPRDTKSLLPKVEDKPPEKIDDAKASPVDQGGDWMDSAANWFLDTVGDDGDDEVITKKKKKKSKRESDQDDDDEPKIAGPIMTITAISKPPDPEPPEPLPKAKVVAVVKKPAPVAPITVKKTVSASPVVTAKKVPLAVPKPVAKKTVPKAAPPPPEPEAEPPAEEEEKPKKEKKKKEEDPGLLGGYLGDPSGLMGGLGGLWGEEPKKEKKKKKKEKEEEEPEEEIVVPKKAVAIPKVKAPTAGKASPTGKAPLVKKAAPKVTPIKK